MSARRHVTDTALLGRHASGSAAAKTQIQRQANTMGRAHYGDTDPQTTLRSTAVLPPQSTDSVLEQ